MYIQSGKYNMIRKRTFIIFLLLLLGASAGYISSIPSKSEDNTDITWKKGELRASMFDDLEENPDVLLRIRTINNEEQYISLELINLENKHVIYGSGYVLETKVGSQWFEIIEYNKDGLDAIEFEDDRHVLEKHRFFFSNCKGRDGVYRIVKPLSHNYAYVEFEVYSQTVSSFLEEHVEHYAKAYESHN